MDFVDGRRNLVHQRRAVVLTAGNGDSVPRGTLPRDPADETLILILVSGVLPVHVITLVIVWAVATRFGKFSAIKTLGLTWNGKLRLWQSIGLALMLYVAAFLLTLAFGGQGTALDRLVESSRAAALIIAFLG